MDDDWLDARTHRQAPWDYVGVGEDPTNQNKRCEYLADNPEFCTPNDNASLHETGEQFIHPDWPALTGRFVPTEGGQQIGHQGPRASR
jgi:hypothetical protein